MGQRGLTRNALTVRLNFSVLLGPKTPLGRWDGSRRLLLATCEADEANGPCLDVRKGLLDDRVHAFAGGGVQDLAVAQPQSDVVRLAGIAEADEVAGLCVGFVDLGRGGLLLVGVAWDELPGQPIRHVDEAGAVDPAVGHPAPLVWRADIRACSLDGIVVGTGTEACACP